VTVLSERDVRRAAARYLVRCFLAQQAPQVAELARQCGSSPAIVRRAFRRATGRNLGRFLREQQVLRARRLLRWTPMPIEAVARRSGYETERSFFRAFRRSTGTTPARFRETTTATPRPPCCSIRP
jgi:AraC-like DNA-binding protein